MHSSLPTTPFTATGYQTLVQERDELVARRPQAVEELSRARDEGDRSENAAYKAARWELSGIDKRLRFLNKLINQAQVIAPDNVQTVQIGTTVELNSQGKSFRYEIVGVHESNPLKGKLSHQSPVGHALIGHEVGEKVRVMTPNGEIEYKILQITLTS